MSEAREIPLVGGSGFLPGELRTGYDRTEIVFHDNAGASVKFSDKLRKCSEDRFPTIHVPVPRGSVHYKENGDAICRIVFEFCIFRCERNANLGNVFPQGFNCGFQCCTDMAYSRYEIVGPSWTPVSQRVPRQQPKSRGIAELAGAIGHEPDQSFSGHDVAICDGVRSQDDLIMSFPIRFEIENSSGPKFFVLSSELFARSAVQNFDVGFCLQLRCDDVAGLGRDNKPVCRINRYRLIGTWWHKVGAERCCIGVRDHSAGAPALSCYFIAKRRQLVFPQLLVRRKSSSRWPATESGIGQLLAPRFSPPAKLGCEFVKPRENGAFV